MPKRTRTQTRLQEIGQKIQAGIEAAYKRLPAEDRRLVERHKILFDLSLVPAPKPEEKPKDVTSRGAIEELWCSVKHLLHTEGHLEESIANAARVGNEKALAALGLLLDRARQQRQTVVRLALENELAVCDRCRDDLATRDPIAKPARRQGKERRL